MFNSHFLLVSGLVHAQAVVIQRSNQKSTPVGIVAGTVMLDEAEMSGHAPLLIDAFYDHAKPVAHVILNMKSIQFDSNIGISKQALRAWGLETGWTCEWTSPATRLAESVSVLRGYTNVDVDARHWPKATVEANFRDTSTRPSPHWAMVISCPTMSALSGSSSARLNLKGTYKGFLAYNRSGIPVSASRFVKRDSDFVLCTMVDREPHTHAKYLQPWAQYHLAAGFTQLLVYVEEEDTSWVEDALRGFIRKDQVSIVPFYFGKISGQKKFLTQGAMENHCLYQARGMAKWIAHIDVDEYVDSMRPNVNMLNYRLPELNSKDVAVVLRNVFWGIMPESHRVDVPYPCHLNGRSEYVHPVGRRSKVIMRPEHIDALFPHFVIRQDGYTEVHPDATTELRLNHFKWCDTSGEGCFGTNQSRTNMAVGHTVKELGPNHKRKQLITDDSDWHGRCSNLLAVK